MAIRSLLVASALAVVPVSVAASPWAQVGDNQLRADIELLEASGVISTVTTQWPLPWASLERQLNRGTATVRPAAVQAALSRLRARAARETADGWTTSVYADFTNRASVVRGFDGMGRGDGQAQLALENTSGVFSGRLAVGLISNDFGKKPNKLMLDGTYAAVDLLGTKIYAGYLDHWWGAGQISALQLSNNARPMPQIGFERASAERSSWPVLRWLGPWQFEFFVSKLDGPQIQSNVYYNAARLTISPLPGLEISAAKTEEFCGQGHPCVPLRDYFQNVDFSTHDNNVNGEGAFDVKYSNNVSGVPFQLYAQAMNEDYSIATHSGTSHLAGASVWIPAGANPVKLTAEYTNTIATRSFVSFGNLIYGYTYIDYQYPDGMRYRGRTLGFSLDNDSTLMSLQGNWSDSAGRFYEVSLHHATIGDARSAGTNIVSRVPVKLNLADARIGLPWHGFRLDLSGRVQDDQPRPHGGFAAALEMVLRKDF